MKFGLSETTVQQICTVLARYQAVQSAVLYGSRAKGNYKRGSDIDLTLQGGADLTETMLVRIADDLDDLLLPYTIDLSIFANIDDPAVREHIARAGAMFYEQDARIVV